MGIPRTNLVVHGRLSLTGASHCFILPHAKPRPLSLRLA